MHDDFLNQFYNLNISELQNLQTKGLITLRFYCIVFHLTININ